MPRISIIPLVLIFSVLATPSVAKDTPLISGTVGVSAEDFHYEEEDNLGKIIDTEDGYLPGLWIDVQVDSGSWFVSGNLYYKKGEVDYVAYPSSPFELNSQTSETIREASLILGFQHEITATTKLEYLAGLGIRIWDRDIHSLPDIPGLYETYEWPYISLGIKPFFQISPNNGISLLLQAKQVSNATLDVKFKVDVYDPVELKLDEGLGIYLEALWLHQFDNTISIGFGPYLELWRFDQSDDFTLTKNGIPVGSVHEPKNLTRNIGLQLLITKNF